MNIDQVIEKRDRLKPAMNEFKRLESIVRAYELIIEALKESRTKGMTKRELRKSTKFFDRLNINQSQYLLDDLVKKGIAEYKPVKTPSGRGRPRIAYFYTGGDE